MNREILFRGKKIDAENTREWIEGYYVPLTDDLHYLLTGKLEITKSNITFEHIPVDPSTVEQFTGLTDKNGKKIFEGDICEAVGEDEFLKVSWDYDEAMFMLKGSTFSLSFTSFYQCEIEIIGNIYDNPELLDGGDTD